MVKGRSCGVSGEIREKREARELTVKLLGRGRVGSGQWNLVAWKIKNLKENY